MTLTEPTPIRQQPDSKPVTWARSLADRIRTLNAFAAAEAAVERRELTAGHVDAVAVELRAWLIEVGWIPDVVHDHLGPHNDILVAAGWAGQGGQALAVLSHRTDPHIDHTSELRLRLRVQVFAPGPGIGELSINLAAPEDD